MKTKQNICL